ncbi:MAG: hypothetical protein GY938_26965 [Ketobacter sp.]|nr:hypothetical protein [Ketobacter sp.]
MSNLFDNAAKNLKNSKFVIVAYAAFFLMAVMGVVFFTEDAASSYYGIKELEEVFKITPHNFGWITYLAMSLAPQIFILGFAYAVAHDTEKNKWLMLAIVVFFVVDLISDWQNRSAGQLLTFSQDGVKMTLNASTYASLFFTLMYFTIMSEVALSVSLGMLISLYPAFITQYVKVFTETRAATRTAKRKIAQAHKNERKPQRNNQSDFTRPQGQQRRHR